MNMHVLNMSERTTPSHWWTCCQFSQLFYQEKPEGKENETEPDRKSGWLDMFERAGLQLWLCWSTDGHHQSAKLSKPPLLTLGLPEFLDFWPCLLPTNVLPSSAPLIIQLYSSNGKYVIQVQRYNWGMNMKTIFHSINQKLLLKPQEPMKKHQSVSISHQSKERTLTQGRNETVII